MFTIIVFKIVSLTTPVTALLHEGINMTLLINNKHFIVRVLPNISDHSLSSTYGWDGEYIC